MHQYKLVSKKGEGTFSEVLKAQSIKTGQYAAIKCLKNQFKSIDQVNSLREIQALRKLSPHQNIIQLQEVLYDEPSGRLALVFELMDQNMYELIKDRKKYLSQSKVQYYMYQLLKSIDHIHRNQIFHRDIKPENILLLNDHVKLADFGSCKGIFSEHPYTEYISTRWYRPPECLLTDGYYSFEMDLWGVGCVFFEIVSLFPAFPGNDELDQINRIHNILGTPSKDILNKFQKHATHMEMNFQPKVGTGLKNLIPHASKDCIDLITKLLMYNPDERITASDALKHDYFRDIHEQEQKKDLDSSLNSSSKFSVLSINYKIGNNYSKKPYRGNIGLQKKNKLTNSIKADTNLKSLNMDSSTEMEDFDKKNYLPPIKNQFLNLDNKFPTFGNIPKNDTKKIYSKQFVPTIPSQYQKSKINKNSSTNDYVIMGKKAIGDKNTFKKNVYQNF